jgi:maltose alpha-D-glucosyltransferase/alpha-amylase
MQWSADRNAGFSAANPQQLYLPLILDPQYNYEAVNVELQRSNTSSLFWFMKRMIAMRRNYAAFGRGSMKFLPVENAKVLAFMRTHEEENILVVINLSKHAQPAEVDLAAYAGSVPHEAFSRNAFPVIREDRPYFFSLSGHAFQWFLLQKKKETTAATLPPLSVEHWHELGELPAKEQLQKHVLPLYLSTRKWFKGSGRGIHTLTLRESLPLRGSDPQCTLLLLEVIYESGLPEMYQLVVTFLGGEAAIRVREEYPESVIVNLHLGEREGVLCDAFYTAPFQQFLASRWASPAEAIGEGGSIRFVKHADGSNTLLPQPPVVKATVVDDNNTSINYGSSFYVKMYRKLEVGLQPDVEVSTYLADEKGFSHLPRLLGTFEAASAEGSITLGMLQEMVENHGTGRTYLLQRIQNAIERILARDRSMLHPETRIGSYWQPAPFDALPDDVKILIGARAAEHARLLGERTGEMHLALGSDSHLKEFIAEEFSLHYQRSLFSSMQSSVRETYQNLGNNMHALPEFLHADAQGILDARTALLERFKTIYSKKLDVQKIRVHGNFTPEKILLTGKDIVIQDFAGNTARSYSERRLKRSPMTDVADMVVALYGLGYEGFASNKQLPGNEQGGLLPFASQWAYFMSGFFLEAYFNKVAAAPFIPDARAVRKMFVQHFLLDRSLIRLNYLLKNDPSKAVAPLTLLVSILSDEAGTPG